MIIVNGWKFRSAGGSFDTDAQAYFTAAGITDATTQSAVNQLVLDLKAASLWTSLKDLQLWTNADATKNKYNVKDPQNTDAAFRSVPAGTVTHTNSGIVGDGSTGYIDLKLNPSTALTHNAWSMGIYSQTNNTTTAFDFGSYDGGANADGISLYNGGSIVGAGEDFGNYATGTPSSTDGFWFLSRTSSTSVSIYRNGGTAVGTNTTANGANHPNYNLYALAWNIAGSPFYYSNRKICLVIIFNTGLNSTQVGTLTTAIQAWANTLGIKIN